MKGGLPKVRWATWIPHGSMKDIFIGDYDYKYLFMVRRMRVQDIRGLHVGRK